MFIHLHTLIQCTGNSAKNKANKNPCFHEVYILVEERSRQLTHKLSTYIYVIIFLSKYLSTYLSIYLSMYHLSIYHLSDRSP